MKKTIYVTMTIIVISCSIKRPIKYDTYDVDEYVNEINQVIYVDDFTDLRFHSDKHFIQFTHLKVYDNGYEKYCINAEEHYENVPQQISDITAEHFVSANLFKDANRDPNLEYDLILKASVEEFFAKLPYSNVKAVTNNFGLVGAVVGEAIDETKYETSEFFIRFKDISILNSEGEKLFDVDEVYLYEEDFINVDGYCWAPYHSVNEKLKLAIEKLAENIAEKFQSELKTRY